MRLDSTLAFVALGSPLSIVAASGVAIPSQVIDMLGNGVGVAPTSIFGTTTTWGADEGIGAFRPELMVAMGTAATTSNSATLNVQLQAAADQGAAGNYQPSTWYTLAETGTIAASSLTANAIIARLPWLPAFPINLRPRFLRLNFAVASATAFTAGTIAFAIPTFVRDDLNQKNQPKNYVVA